MQVWEEFINVWTPGWQLSSWYFYCIIAHFCDAFCEIGFCIFVGLFVYVFVPFASLRRIHLLLKIIIFYDLLSFWIQEQFPDIPTKGWWARQCLSMWNIWHTVVGKGFRCVEMPFVIFISSLYTEIFFYSSWNTCD